MEKSRRVKSCQTENILDSRISYLASLPRRSLSTANIFTTSEQGQGQVCRQSTMSSWIPSTVDVGYSPHNIQTTTT